LTWMNIIHQFGSSEWMYLDEIYSFILSAMGITSTLKYLNLLPHEVLSRVHLS